MNRVYIPDLLAVAGFTRMGGIGAGVGNYLVYGEYPEEDTPNARLFLPAGVIRGRDLTKVERFDPAKITEHIRHSWYEYEGGDGAGKHPSQGETKPKYTGPKPPYERLDTAAKYSWLKSPRYDGLAMEVGPLARMLVAYASGHARVQQLVNGALGKLGVGPAALFSTLGRVAARGLETALLAEKMETWLDELGENMARRDLRIHDNTRWDPDTLAARRDGRGLPRGAPWRAWDTGCTSRTARSATTSVSSRAPGTRGRVMRRATAGPTRRRSSTLPVADAEKPLELLRTVHSFDPCIACGVHVVDAKKSRTGGREGAVMHGPPSGRGGPGLRVGVAGPPLPLVASRSRSPCWPRRGCTWATPSSCSTRWSASSS